MAPVDLLVGIGLGLAASLLGWWIVARAVTPRITVGATVLKRPDTTRRATWRYSVTITNRRRWWLPDTPAVDVRISVSLRIKGLSDPEVWTLFRLPAGDSGEVDMLMRARRFRLRVYDISPEQGDFHSFPDTIQSAIRTGDVELESLLSLGSEAELRVVVSGVHGYTQGRTTTFARFGLADIAAIDAESCESADPSVPVGPAG